MIGRVTAVQERYAGSQLAVALVGGESTVTVSDATDFDEAGTIYFPDTLESNAYTAVNTTTGVITLTGTVASAHVVDDTEVRVYPLVIERTATIKTSDSALDDEAIEARVSHALFDRLPIGIRDEDAGEGESVTAVFIGDELVVTEIMGRAPLVDGTYIDPTTISTGSDGLAPSGSPTAVVQSAIGALAVSWTAVSNADLVSYDIYIGTSANPATSSLNHVTTVTGGTSVFLRTDALGATLSALVTYHVQIIARDADGSAAAGTEGTGSPIADPAASDGVAPTTSPGIDHITPGYAFFGLAWTAISNNGDQAAYQIHCSTASGFTPGPTTLCMKTITTAAVVRQLPNGAPFAYGTTYYFRLVSQDADGVCSTAGTQASGVLTQLDGTADIVASTITAASILADSITANEIAANTITADEIAANTITAAKIAAHTITAASGVVNDLTVDILTTGTLSATVTLSGTIATGTSGPRWEMTTAHLRAYDGSSTDHGFGVAGVTFDVPASGGAAFLYGSLRATKLLFYSANTGLANDNSVQWWTSFGGFDTEYGRISAYNQDATGTTLSPHFFAYASAATGVGSYARATFGAAGDATAELIFLQKRSKYMGVLLYSSHSSSFFPAHNSIGPSEYSTAWQGTGVLWWEDGNGDFMTTTASGVGRYGILSSFLGFGNPQPYDDGAGAPDLAWGRVYSAGLNSLQNYDGGDATYTTLLRAPVIDERYSPGDGEWPNRQMVGLATMGSSTAYGYWSYQEYGENPADSTANNTAGAGEGWYWQVSSGTVVDQADEVMHPGIWRVSCSAAGATSGAFSAWGAALTIGSGRVRVGSIIRVPTLSNATDRFTAGVMIANSGTISSAVTNMIAIRYTDNVNSGNWQAYVYDGTGNTADLGINVTAGNWYFLEMEVNSAGTSVEFFINGVSKGTLSTHVPPATVYSYVSASLFKTAGTSNARSIDIDSAYVYGAVATHRWT